MANSEFIEIISEQTKAQIDAIMPLVRELAKSIKDINSFSVSGTPSGADKNINALNDAYNKRAENIAKVRTELEKTTAVQKQIENSAKNQTSSTQKLTKAELDYVSAVERGLKAKEREVLATKKLNDAYGQLTTKRNEAARALQNSIVATGKYSTETKKLQKEFDILNKKVGEADKAIGKFSQANNGFQQLAGGIRNFVSAFGVTMGIGLAIDIGKNIYETTKQLQSLDLALKMVSGSQIEFKNNQIFLRGLAEQYGIEIKGLTKNFTEFWVASKGKLEAEQIKEIFTSISKSVAVMGLSVEQQDSAFLALQQMMSKGTVQAEELKKQLGNALPGAIKAATMAYQALHPEMKVTEKFFMEQMKAGKVLSAELLPELAKQYEKLYGIENVKRAETLQAAQERLANSWTDMVRSMNESETSGIAVFFKAIAGGLTNTLRLLTRYNTEWNKLNEKSEEKGRLFGFEITETKGKTTAQLLEGRNKLFEASKKTADEITKLKAKFAKEGFFSEINPFSDTGADIEKLYADLGQYKGAIEKINQILHPSSKPKALPVEETEDERKKREEKERKAREKAQKERLDDIYNMNKSQLELELTKSELILNNDIKSYEERLKALDRYNKIKQQLIELAYKHDLDSAKGNSFKEKDAAAKHSKELLLQTEDYLKKRTDLLKKQYADESMDETIKELEKVQEEINKAKLELEEKSIDNQVKKFKELDKKANKERTEEQKRQFEAAINSFNTFVGDFANKSGFGESFDLFLKLDEDGKTMFDNLISHAQTSEEKFKVAFQGIATAAQDTLNLIGDMENQRYDNRIARLDKEKEVALRFAGDSASAKEKIEADYEKRRKELELKRFKSQQKMALANIAIDTAQAIMQIWSHSPDPTGISQGLMTGIITTIGLAQAAMVAAQKPPEYWTGTDNAEAGLAYTQERGPEIILDKNNRIKSFGSDEGAQLTMMSKGDKVKTASETKKIMFDNELNNIMTNNGIKEAKIEIINKGLTIEQMDSVLAKHFSNIQTNHTSFDKNGIRQWSERNGNITIRNEARGSGQGFSV